jgi:DHA1 family bicyclomycin/chloramphenicol resistance-like MFS transporter
MGYALTGGLYYGGAFAYVAGTPFAYIGYHHVPAEAYGLLFGLGIVGVMAANIVNVRLVPRLGSARLLQVGAILAAASGVASAVDARFDWGGLVGLVASLFVYMSVAELIVANSVAGALASFPHRAGAVSALVGALHYGTGVLGAAMVGWFSDGTPWPMGWIIGAFGIGSWATAALLVRRKST